MRGGYHRRLSKPQRVGVGGYCGDILAIGFVQNQMRRFTAASQAVGDLLITQIDAVTGIEQKQHNISFVDRHPDLVRHQAIQTILIAYQTTGINNKVGSFTDLAITVLAVAGQSGKICHQRITAAGQLIKQRGLADIGPTDNGDNRKHGVNNTRPELGGFQLIKCQCATGTEYQQSFTENSYWCGRDAITVDPYTPGNRTVEAG